MVVVGVVDARRLSKYSRTCVKHMVCGGGDFGRSDSDMSIVVSWCHAMT
jgi:hypothetical protein